MIVKPLPNATGDPLARDRGPAAAEVCEDSRQRRQGNDQESRNPQMGAEELPTAAQLDRP